MSTGKIEKTNDRIKRGKRCLLAIEKEQVTIKNDREKGGKGDYWED